MQLINRTNQMHRYAETLKYFQAPCTPFQKERLDIERYLPFIRTIHSSLFPTEGITTTLAITTLNEKTESCRYSRVPLYI